MIPAPDFGPVGEGVTFLPRGNARGHVPGPGFTTPPTRNVGGLSPKTEPCEPISLFGTRPGTLHASNSRPGSGPDPPGPLPSPPVLILRCNRGWWVGHKRRLAPALGLEIPWLSPTDSPSSFLRGWSTRGSSLYNSGSPVQSSGSAPRNEGGTRTRATGRDISRGEHGNI